MKVNNKIPVVVVVVVDGRSAVVMVGLLVLDEAVVVMATELVAVVLIELLLGNGVVVVDSGTVQIIAISRCHFYRELEAETSAQGSLLIIKQKQKKLEGTHRVRSHTDDWLRHLANINEARTKHPQSCRQLASPPGECQ